MFPSQSLFEMVSELQGDPGYPLGRFGTAITALTDINGDGLTDVAVGAPLEGQGAVYIFNGKPGGLSPQPSQVRYPACPSNWDPSYPEASKLKSEPDFLYLASPGLASISLLHPAYTRNPGVPRNPVVWPLHPWGEGPWRGQAGRCGCRSRGSGDCAEVRWVS